MGVLILAFDGNLPTFPNLIRLEAGVDAYFGWKLLPHFLNNSPNLEALILKKEYAEGSKCSSGLLREGDGKYSEKERKNLESSVSLRTSTTLLLLLLLQ
ncbi:hypothetical protein Q3G72_030732 [Acer saccharum]|nr:hypothetical protein Q3G72_030732 [Acer saccharum]